MSRRIEVELTSAKGDGTWTWRAVGAKQPKGVVDAALLYEGAAVGDVVRADADFEIEGILITAVLPPREKKRAEPQRLEVIGPPREHQGVTSSLVAKSDRPRPERGRDGDRDGRPGRDGGFGDRRPGGASRPRDDGAGRQGGRPAGAEGRPRPDGRAEGRPRPEGRAEGRPRPEGRAEGRPRPEGRAEGRPRPEGRAEGRPRPEGGGPRPAGTAGSGEHRPDRSSRPDRGPRPEGGQRDGGQRPPAGRERRREVAPPAESMPKPRRLAPANLHRSAVVETLPPEQRPIAEQVLRGGIPAVRQAVEAQNARLREEGQPEVHAGPLVALAEQLLPQLKAAEWRDRAEAAAKVVDDVSLRDLRSVVSGADAARDDEGRILAGTLRQALERRVGEQRENWVTDISGSLDEGRLVRALRLSAHPPDPSTRFPAELAVRLSDAAGVAMTAEATPDRWATLLEAVVDSPVRRSVRPAGLPAEPGEPLLQAARQASGRVPALAALLGISMPPPPGPPRPPRPGGRPPRAAGPSGARRRPPPPPRPAPDGEAPATTAAVARPVADAGAARAVAAVGADVPADSPTAIGHLADDTPADDPPASAPAGPAECTAVSAEGSRPAIAADSPTEDRPVATTEPADGPNDAPEPVKARTDAS